MYTSNTILTSLRGNVSVSAASLDAGAYTLFQQDSIDIVFPNTNQIFRLNVTEIVEEPPIIESSISNNPLTSEPISE